MVVVGIEGREQGVGYDSSMYRRDSHRPRHVDDVFAVMERHMFATMVTSSGEGLIASHLPFVVDAQRGPHGTLFAHMARANPQTAAVSGAEEALVIFNGPHAYVSPSWYADRATAPTWDYIAVHCYGRIRQHTEEEALANVQRLLAVVEAGGRNQWTLTELDAAEITALLRNIVSFEITVERLEGKFKLNQGEKIDRTKAAIVELERQGMTELAQYMRRYNDLR
jgi:transcriptional regulator